jgi:hypothetical protein
MYVSRGQVAQALMRPFVVIQLEIIFQSGGQNGHGVVLVDVDVLVFDRPPQTLNNEG